MTTQQKKATKEERAVKGRGPSKRKWNYSKSPFDPKHKDHQLRICYFMGLCGAILLTDEVHRQNGTWKLEVVEEKVRDENGVLIDFTRKHTGKIMPDLKSDELSQYAHKLGDRFYFDHLQEQELLKRQRKAVKRLKKQKVA